MKLLKRLFREEDGATMVEYALLVALISIAAIAVLLLLGPVISGLFQRVLTALQGAGGGGSGT